MTHGRAAGRRVEARVPGGARPAARRARPPVRRPRPGRGGRLGGHRGGAGALAGRRRAGRSRAPGCSPRRGGKAVDRLRRDRAYAARLAVLQVEADRTAPAAASSRGTTCPTSGCSCSSPAAIRPCRWRRRRADAALPGRADHAGGGAGVPGARPRRWPSGSCGPSARSGTRASRSACRARTSCRTGCPGVLQRDLLDLHRGVRGQRRRRAAAARPRRGGDPAGPDPAPAAARRARGGRAAGADAAGPRPARGPHRARRRAGAARRPGPLALGPPTDRRGRALVRRRADRRPPGPYAVQAAIAACTTRPPTSAATDWPQVVALYDVLARVAPSPVVALNRAVAVAMRDGPAAGLALLDELAADDGCAATTCCPRPGPTCCAGSAAGTRRPPPTGRRWTWWATNRNARSCAADSTISQPDGRAIRLVSRRRSGPGGRGPRVGTGRPRRPPGRRRPAPRVARW